MPPRVHYLTPEGKQKLLDELKYLRDVRRLEVADNLRSALEGGDLTENAGYEEAKREQAFVEGRIQDIEMILANSVLLESDGQKQVVTLGSRVTILEEGGEPETYQIVGRAEAGPLAGRISNESPLGAALLGGRIGQTVSVQTPDGMLQFEIIAIN